MLHLSQSRNNCLGDLSAGLRELEVSAGTFWLPPHTQPTAFSILLSAPKLTSVGDIVGSQGLWPLVGFGHWGALGTGGREESEVRVFLPWLLLCELGWNCAL